MKNILHIALFHHPHALAQGLAHSQYNQSHTPLTVPAKFLVKYYLFKLWLSRLPKTHIQLALAGAIIAPLAYFTISFLLPQTVVYSYAGTNCVFNPTLVPNMLTAQSHPTYSLQHTPTVSIGTYPLFSTRTCVNLQALPDAENTQEKTLTLTALGVLNKKITITSAQLPQPTLMTELAEPIALTADLEFKLDKPDSTFSYVLTLNETIQSCDSKNMQVICNLSALPLKQGAEYAYTLEQVLKDEKQSVANGKLTLQDPLRIINSSMTADATVYDSPSSLTLTTDKEMRNDIVDAALTIDNNPQPIATLIDGTSLAITFSEPLQRQKTYTLVIKTLEAIDGSFLAEPYTLQFSTSGGPQVQGVSISSYDVSPSASITLTFDSPLASNADEFVAVVVGGAVVTSNSSISGNSIRINPTSNLPACTAFSVRVGDGLSNSYGITGGSAWSMNSRTTCKQVFSIGTSVQGRAITAYRFGSGSTKILFVGGMHGDEKSSVRTLNSFIDDLERNYPSIPADKTIVVIPNVNPDGYVASTRVNANTVDLNRNFPTFDWVTEAYLPRGVYLPNGGGVTALSEPESAALASYTTTLSPRLTLTFHATGRAAFANGSGDSQALTHVYASESGFTSYSQADEDAFFSYQTTGEYENWMHDKLGLPAILVELASVGNNEFTRQKPALWAMLRI